ncbi:MAG TPA: hypothetical protein DD490_07520 [Acidobacteria bacterium]|nr:hypothetical protein [Acidobacteriota bacterium]
MSNEEPLYNGVDARTGAYLPAWSDREVLRELRVAPMDPAAYRTYLWWVEQFGIDDPFRQPVHRVDPKSLASAGWCVIFAPDVSADVRKALSPLLRHRSEQAGTLYQEFTYEIGQTKEQFLQAKRADNGPADPRFVPYYVLLVGDPRTLPFQFQYDLDVQYAVGRLYFEKVEDYGNYAAGVLAAEKDNSVRPPRRIAFFGTSNKGDRPTERTLTDLVRPLAEALRDQYRHWPQARVFGEEAIKRNLGPLVGGPERAALLMAATHGMRFPAGDPLQMRDQGALLCQEWERPAEGEEKAIPPEQYFSSVDVSAEADLRGMIAFLFACYSAGTPEVSDFDAESGVPHIDTPSSLAPRTFLSGLAKSLLAHPKGGCLAVLGHVDRAFTLSFSWSGRSQPQVFESVLGRLLDGYPIGAATEFINQRHAELAVSTNRDLLGWQEAGYLSASGMADLARRVKAGHDARNFVVLGDPAVRLTWRE